MARARDTFFAELEEAEPKASGAQPQSQDVHSEKAAERPVTGRETMLSNEEFVDVYKRQLKGQIGYESFIMDLIFENGSRLSRKWIVFCNNILCRVLCICMAVFGHSNIGNM